jgi:hypothetical protein
MQKEEQKDFLSSTTAIDNCILHILEKQSFCSIRKVEWLTCIPTPTAQSVWISGEASSLVSSQSDGVSRTEHVIRSNRPLRFVVSHRSITKNTRNVAALSLLQDVFLVTKFHHESPSGGTCILRFVGLGKWLYPESPSGSHRAEAAWIDCGSQKERAMIGTL